MKNHEQNDGSLLSCAVSNIEYTYEHIRVHISILRYSCGLVCISKAQASEQSFLIFQETWGNVAMKCKILCATTLHTF